jgi:hypothetical protein
MLSESLKVYFQTWEKLLGIKCQPAFADLFKKQGFWSGYKECFRLFVPLDWDACPASLSVIEQTIMARNASQHHAGDIGSLQAHHPKSLWEKFKRPIFIHEHEKQLSEVDRASVNWFGSELIITRETLEEAIREADALVEWLEPQFQEHRWGHPQSE